MSQDFEELLESLNAKGVRYLIGGAHALAFHGRPRATKDLGVFVAPTAANAKRFMHALADFFGGSAPSYVTAEALLDPNLSLQLGVAPVRVDVLSHFATLSFAEAWRTRVDAKLGAVELCRWRRHEPSNRRAHIRARCVRLTHRRHRALVMLTSSNWRSLARQPKPCSRVAS